MRSIAALSASGTVKFGAGVGENGMAGAKLLFVGLAGGTLSARIHKAAHTCKVAGFKALHFSANGSHSPNDFVTGNAGVGGYAPFTADGMNV